MIRCAKADNEPCEFTVYTAVTVQFAFHAVEVTDFVVAPGAKTAGTAYVAVADRHEVESERKWQPSRLICTVHDNCELPVRVQASTDDPTMLTLAGLDKDKQEKEG